MKDGVLGALIFSNLLSMIHLVLCALHVKMGTEVYIWQEDRLCEEESWMSDS